MLLSEVVSDCRSFVFFQEIYIYILYFSKFQLYTRAYVRDMEAATLTFLLKYKPIIYIFSYLGKIINTLIQRLMGKDPFLRRHCLNSV